MKQREISISRSQWLYHPLQSSDRGLSEAISQNKWPKYGHFRLGFDTSEERGYYSWKSEYDCCVVLWAEDTWSLHLTFCDIADIVRPRVTMLGILPVQCPQCPAIASGNITPEYEGYKDGRCRQDNELYLYTAAWPLASAGSSDRSAASHPSYPHQILRSLVTLLPPHISRVTPGVTPGVTTVHKPGQDTLALNSPHQHYKTPPAWCSCQPLICPPLVRICKYTKRRADSRFVAVELWIQHSDDNSGEYSQCSGWVCWLAFAALQSQGSGNILSDTKLWTIYCSKYALRRNELGF